MDQLSDELLFGILIYVPPQELLCGVNLVCKRWNSLISCPGFWKNHPLFISQQEQEKQQLHSPVSPSVAASPSSAKISRRTTTKSNDTIGESFAAASSIGTARTPPILSECISIHQIQQICLFKSAAFLATVDMMNAIDDSKTETTGDRKRKTAAMESPSQTSDIDNKNCAIDNKKNLPVWLRPQSVLPTIQEARALMQATMGRRLCCIASTTDHYGEQLVNVLPLERFQYGLDGEYDSEGSEEDDNGYHDLDRTHARHLEDEEEALGHVITNMLLHHEHVNVELGNINNDNMLVEQNRPPRVRWHRRHFPTARMMTRMSAERWWSSKPSRTTDSTETLLFATLHPCTFVNRLKIKPLADPQNISNCYTWESTIVKVYRIPINRLFGDNDYNNDSLGHSQDPHHRDTGGNDYYSHGHHSSDYWNYDNRQNNHDQYKNKNEENSNENNFAPCSFSIVPQSQEKERFNNSVDGYIERQEQQEHHRRLANDFFASHVTLFRAPCDQVAIEAALHGLDPVYTSKPFEVPRNKNDEYEFNFDSNGGGVVANVICVELLGKHNEQFPGQGYYACVENVDIIGIPLFENPSIPRNTVFE